MIGCVVRELDVKLYLCNGAFAFLSWDVVERLSDKLVFPIYLAMQAALLLWLMWSVLTKWG